MSNRTEETGKAWQRIITDAIDYRANVRKQYEEHRDDIQRIRQHNEQAWRDKFVELANELSRAYARLSYFKGQRRVGDHPLVAKLAYDGE